VQAGDGTSVKVRPFADFSRLEFVRVVDYGVTRLVGSSNPPTTALPPAGPRGR
jgi:rod shape-determining protein MreC